MNLGSSFACVKVLLRRGEDSLTLTALQNHSDKQVLDKELFYLDTVMYLGVGPALMSIIMRPKCFFNATGVASLKAIQRISASCFRVANGHRVKIEYCRLAVFTQLFYSFHSVRPVVRG